MAKSTVRIGAAQGFYGDSPMAAMALAQAGAVDFLVHDALAELTLAILQKDRQKDPTLGYARDIELYARTLYPMAFAKGIRVVSNSGGLNPLSAAQKVSQALTAAGITGKKIAAITGDDLLPRLEALKQAHPLNNMDTGVPLSEEKRTPTHANAYIGAASIKEALDAGADLILAGRVADPCLTLGILAHHFGWELEHTDASGLDRLASGIAIGHLLECGGQASGGNSYAEWPMPYTLYNLAYPIAEVSEDGSAVFSRLTSEGGTLTRDTLREQLIYEVHDPANYLTPDVTADFSHIIIETLGPDSVRVSGAKGRQRPEQLKLNMGLMDGFLSDQFFFFSWPHAHQKAQMFIEAVKGIWARLPITPERAEFSLVGVNGIHGSAAPMPADDVLDQVNEIGVRIAIQHREARHGKTLLQAITCLGLNGPPGLISVPGWGNDSRMQLALWPTLVPRSEVKTEVHIYES
jgi:hypothetical protein